jgi:hypothetical protein
LLVAGGSLLVAGCWWLVTGYWLLVARCWWLVVDEWVVLSIRFLTHLGVLVFGGVMLVSG